MTSSRSAVSACSVSRTSCGLSRSPLVAVAERELLAPGGELAQPRLGPGYGARTVECAQLVREVGEHLLQRPDDRDVRLAELRDLGGVDVEVDDRRAGRERRELARDAVVEARADGDEEVALVHRPVRPLRPVHPGPAEVELVRLRERALAHQRRHDRKRAELGERAQLVARVGVERPAADVEDGLLRRRRAPRRRARSDADGRAAAASSRGGRPRPGTRSRARPPGRRAGCRRGRGRSARCGRRGTRP